MAATSSATPLLCRLGVETNLALGAVINGFEAAFSIASPPPLSRRESKIRVPPVRNLSAAVSNVALCYDL